MSAVLVWPLAVCLLVVPVLFVVLTIPTWIERQTDATDAARNAARTLATADTWDHGVAAANAVVTDIARNNGLDPSQVTASYTGSLQPGSTVTASVTVTIPAATLPAVGAVAQTHWTATVSARIDDHRNPG